MSLRSVLLLLLVGASVLTVRRSTADPAAAEALFHEGHRLLEEGRNEEAALKLAESQAQDPASGTLINLALAYERQGRLATAWATYQEAANLARRDGRADRAASAERKHAELEPRVPVLTFRAEQAQEGLSITCGRIKIGIGGLDSEIPIDPGEYQIAASAPARVTWQVSLTVVEGERRTITIPELPFLPAPVAAPAPPRSAGTAASPERSRLAPRPAQSRAPANSWRGNTLAWVLGASGLVSVGTGTVFGIRALTRYANAERQCPSHKGCTAGALDDSQAAKTSASIADFTLGFGVAACAGSLWLFLRPHGGEPPKVALDVLPLPGGAALGLRTRL
jgi:tetratricopeptide (TPR) repeat protein